jgi:hypothetical protein
MTRLIPETYKSYTRYQSQPTSQDVRVWTYSLSAQEDVAAQAQQQEGTVHRFVFSGVQEEEGWALQDEI